MTNEKKENTYNIFAVLCMKKTKFFFYFLSNNNTNFKIRGTEGRNKIKRKGRLLDINN